MKYVVSYKEHLDYPSDWKPMNTHYIYRSDEYSSERMSRLRFLSADDFRHYLKIGKTYNLKYLTENLTDEEVTILILKGYELRQLQDNEIFC